MFAFFDAAFCLSSYLSKRVAAGEVTAFTTSDPLRLWIIQVGTIIMIAQLLSFGLRRLRQPRVIAEVVGGIILGPTAFGRIPGFTETIFPSASLPYLSLVADIGLCLFVFLVGLEIDTGVVAHNARMSVIVSLAGIAVPFGLGTILSIPIYHRFIDPSVHFTSFMLFTGVAYSITAFPILCRILRELKLLDTHVGVIVLSAGVGNDIVGWTLLALSVALVNAGSGLSALWTLLICITFAIFLLLPIKFIMCWLARKTGSTENGPSVFYMTVVMILVWACAFFTDSIGVNAIFGAFLAGLVVPREGGLAITLTEKLEDIVSIVFLPLYFALSGLNTNLGLLDDAITWAFTIAIIVLSFFGKFGGCSIASRLAGCGWRESSAIGALMSCKGLIELIVLNVGLEAGILSQRVFSMFVLEALTLTFITTPLVTILYPPERRVRFGKTTPPVDSAGPGPSDEEASIVGEIWRHRFTVVLDKLDHIPGAMTLTQLILPPRGFPSTGITPTATAVDTTDTLRVPSISVGALQLIELSDRTSAMTAADMDPVLGIFRTFGELNELAVTTSLSVVPYDDFARSVAEHAQRHASHLILLPWLPPTAPTTIDTSDAATSPPEIHSQFVPGVFAKSKTDVALFIDMQDRSRGCVGGPMHIFLPFFGGPDDRLALAFVVQLCLNPKMTATVVRIMKDEGSANDCAEGLKRPSAVRQVDARTLGDCGNGSTMTSTIAVYDPPTSEMRLQSEMADDVAWSKYVDAKNPTLQRAMTRIRFSGAHTQAPVHATICHARALRETSPRLLVVAARSIGLVEENYYGEMEKLLETCQPGMGVEGMRRTIGDIGTAMVASGSASAMVILQAAAN